jgi:hypothetical protein
MRKILLVLMILMIVYLSFSQTKLTFNQNIDVNYTKFAVTNDTSQSTIKGGFGW